MSTTWTQETGSVALTKDALLNVSEDTSPQLGGNLDTNSKSIYSSTSALTISGGPSSAGVLTLESTNTGSDKSKLNLNPVLTSLDALNNLEIIAGGTLTIKSLDETDGASTIVIQSSKNIHMKFGLNASNGLKLTGIPFSRPDIEGMVYADGEPVPGSQSTLKISGGPLGPTP